MADQTANKIIETYDNAPVLWIEVPLAAGAITLYRGENVNIDSAGYYVKGSDSATDLFFGGVVWEPIVQAAGGSNGDNTIRIIPPHTGQIVKFKTATGLTRITGASGTKVYVVDGGTVDLAAATTNDILVGTIFRWIAANDIWVTI